MGARVKCDLTRRSFDERDKMEMIQGLSYIFVLSIALLALAIYFNSKNESRVIAELRTRMAEIERFNKTAVELVNCHNLTIAKMVTLLKEIEQEVLNYQDHAARQDQEIIRLAKAIAWKRPIIRAEVMLTRKERGKSCQ